MQKYPFKRDISCFCFEKKIFFYKFIQIWGWDCYFCGGIRWAVGSWQSSVFSWQLAVLSWQSSVGSGQSSVGSCFDVA